MDPTSSTSTAIRLNDLQQSSNLVQRDGLRAEPSPHHDTDEDPVLEASRLADSTVPDGGYGWVVVIACSTVAWWFVGTSYSWGVIQDALVAEGVASPATLAFVGSLSAGLISALAIINARVIRWIGARSTALLGVFFLGMSAITSSFAVKNVTGMFFTSGVILGLGLR
jgi:hypothetical protein